MLRDRGSRCPGGFVRRAPLEDPRGAEDRDRGPIDLRNRLEPGKELRKHNFKFEGEETINTRVGEINTVKYSQQREGSSRTTYIWFSTDHDFAPVELERVRNGKTFSTLKLTTLEQ